MKRKVYQVLLRPVMMYGFETVVLTEKQEAGLEVAASLKMLRLVWLRVARMDMTRNECIGETAQVELFEDKVREVR